MKWDLESSLEKINSRALMKRSSMEADYYSPSFVDIHPGVLSFVLPVITCFLTIFSLAVMPPIAILSPFIIGISFLVGSILGFKGIVKDVKTQSYGMLIISILGTAINLLPTMVVGLILVAIVVFGVF